MKASHLHMRMDISSMERSCFQIAKRLNCKRTHVNPNPAHDPLIKALPGVLQEPRFEQLRAGPTKLTLLKLVLLSQTT